MSKLKEKIDIVKQFEKKYCSKANCEECAHKELCKTISEFYKTIKK